MPIGVFAAFTKTAATAATNVTFDFGGAYETYHLVLPSMPSSTAIQLRMSDSASGTYRSVFEAKTSQSPTTSAPILWALTSTISNCVLQIPALGQYAQVVLVSATTSAGGNAYEFKVLCSGI
jgi:hypothetical protein